MNRVRAAAQEPLKRQLTRLNRDIERTQADASRLEAERKPVVKNASLASSRVRCLRLARWLRRPAESIELWPIAIMIVGPGIAGVLFLVATHLFFGAFPLAALAFLVGSAGTAAIIAALLFRPADQLLESAIAEAEAKWRLEAARVAEKTQRIAEVNEKLQRLVEERRDQITSGKLQRAALLQREWKLMDEAEWEDFIVEILRTLGASVERNAKGGRQDANLNVLFEDRRVAVITRSDDHNVSSATIQQALAAKDGQRCDSCAVIINRRFTGAAQDFAERNGCAAIGTGEFPDFVLGKIEL